MLKYIKYISLSILIILVTYLVILCFSTFINDNKTTNNNVSQNINIVEKLFNNNWYPSKKLVSESGELKEELFFSDFGYINFTEENITQCDMAGEDCKSYNYKVENNILKVTDEFMIEDGEYELKFNSTDNELELLSKNGEKTIVYLFVAPMG